MCRGKSSGLFNPGVVGTLRLGGSSALCLLGAVPGQCCARPGLCPSGAVPCSGLYLLLLSPAQEPPAPGALCLLRPFLPDRPFPHVREQRKGGFCRALVIVLLMSVCFHLLMFPGGREAVLNCGPSLPHLSDEEPAPRRSGAASPVGTSALGHVLSPLSPFSRAITTFLPVSMALGSQAGRSPGPP